MASDNYLPWMDLKVRLKAMIKLLGLACLLCNDFIELGYEGTKKRHCREEQEDAEDLSHPTPRPKTIHPITAL